MLAQKNLSHACEGKPDSGLLRKYMESNYDVTVFIGAGSDIRPTLDKDILKLRAANKNRNKPDKVDS